MSSEVFLAEDLSIGPSSFIFVVMLGATGHNEFEQRVSNTYLLHYTLGVIVVLDLFDDLLGMIFTWGSPTIVFVFRVLLPVMVILGVSHFIVGFRMNRKHTTPFYVIILIDVLTTVFAVILISAQLGRGFLDLFMVIVVFLSIVIELVELAAHLNI